MNDISRYILLSRFLFSAPHRILLEKTFYTQGRLLSLSGNSVNPAKKRRMSENRTFESLLPPSLPKTVYRIADSLRRLISCSFLFSFIIGLISRKQHRAIFIAQIKINRLQDFIIHRTTIVFRTFLQGSMQIFRKAKVCSYHNYILAPNVHYVKSNADKSEFHGVMDGG